MVSPVELPDADDLTEGPRLKVDSLRFGILFALLITAGQRVIGLVRGILFCRILPEEQLGQWSLTWSYLMLLAPLAVLGLPGSFNRYVETYRQRGQLRSFLIRITAVSLSTTLVFSGLMYFAAEPLSHWLYRDGSQAPLVQLMAATLFVVVAFNFAASLMEALRQVRLVTIMRLVNGVAFAILGLGLLVAWSDGSVNGTTAITLGFVLSCLIGLIPAAIYLGRNWSVIDESRQSLPGKTMWARVAPFAIWLWVINLVSNLYETADRAMLLHLAPVSPDEAQALVGQYHSGRVLPLVMVGLAAMLSGILMSYMTAAWERGDHTRVARQLRWTVKLTGIGFTFAGIGVLILAPFLFDIVLQGKYSDGLAVLPLTLVYCIWYSLLTVGQDYLWCGEKGKWACLAIVFGLTVNLLFNAWLIPIHGLYGAVWATAISNIMALVALFLLNSRFGWRPDRGVWLIVFIPAVLLLPVFQAMTIALVVTWAGLHYGWLFDLSEKEELIQTLKAAVGKWTPLQTGRREKAKII